MSDRILNLDEVFGKSRPVIAVYQGIRYELMRPESLSPAQYGEWMRLQAEIEEIRSRSKSLSQEDMAQWDRLLTEVLRMLCPSFAEVNPPFQVRMKTLEFYFEENFKDLKTKEGEQEKN